ncbi:MAG: T9SS type B sorting domain-containing protein [Chitinophagaceae bacterium]
MGFFIKISLLVFVSLLSFFNLAAQLCQGSLGDPIVSITFGSGANPGPSLKAATTSYNYQSADCPQDGLYTVTNNTIGCFNSTWHSISADHTGDPNGYFMLVNASFQPSAFYLDTVRGLCGGTIYEFAAWIYNVLKPTACSPSPTQPNLTFTIEKTDGSILQTYNSNTIASQTNPGWQQFGFFFITPFNVSDIVLRIFNNAPGGCGNDLALDDITFRPCGPQLTAVIARANSSSVTFCEGIASSFSFTGILSAGFNNPSFQWQQSGDGITWADIPAATTTSLTQNFSANTLPGNYKYRLSAAEAGNMNTAQCRIVSNPLSVQVAAIPVTTTSSNNPVCENDTLVLTASGGSQYQWSGVNNFTATGALAPVVNVQPIHAGKYYVLVTSDAGCKQRDSITVIVNPSPVAQTSFTNINICEGDNVQLESSGGSSYQWVPATGLSSAIIAGPLASPSATVQYSVNVFNQFGCSDEAKVMVNVIEAPNANAGTDKWIIKGNSAQLAGNAEGQNISYSWLPDVYINNPRVLQPFVNPPNDTSYILTVLSNDGCGIAKDTVQVFVYKDVFVPNAFSPNDDGLNDTWIIPALNVYPEFEITVFNRQGQIVFHQKNNNRPWNGRFKGSLLPMGVYVYIIDLKLGGDILKGTLALIR